MFIESEESKTKMITVDYKVLIEDVKGNPSVLVTDFSIVNADNGRVEIKAKGYAKLNLNGTKKSGWCSFDDNEENKTRKVWKKFFVNGTKRIKVYNLNT